MERKILQVIWKMTLHVGIPFLNTKYTPLVSFTFFGDILNGTLALKCS